jgi:hypothetical protein
MTIANMLATRRKAMNIQNTMAKEKVQKDKQRSTKHTHKTKYRLKWEKMLICMPNKKRLCIVFLPFCPLFVAHYTTSKLKCLPGRMGF